MPFFGIELSTNKLGVVLGKISALSVLEEVIALIHLDTQRVQRSDNLGCVRDDCFLAVGQFRQIMALDMIEQSQFHLFRIYQNKLQL